MEPQYQRGSNGGGRGSQHYYYYEDDDDFSAEEIFNLFFGYSGMKVNPFLCDFKFILFLRANNSYISASSTTNSLSFYNSFNT
jgi:hypothetical protein